MSLGLYFCFLMLPFFCLIDSRCTGPRKCLTDEQKPWRERDRWRYRDTEPGLLTCNLAYSYGLGMTSNQDLFPCGDFLFCADGPLQ